MPETIERECVGITEQTLDALCPRIGQRIEHPVIRKNTVTLPAPQVCTQGASRSG